MRLSISCIDTLNYDKTLRALKATLAVTPTSRVYWLADRPCPETLNVPVEWIRIKRFDPAKHIYNHWYSHACLRIMPAVVNTDYNLIIHHDGFGVNREAWTDEFYNYDYIDTAIDTLEFYNGQMNSLSMTILAHLGYGGPMVRTWATVDLPYVAASYMMPYLIGNPVT